MFSALALASALLAVGIPKDDAPAAGENVALGPLEVCNAMATAAKARDFETLLGHCSGFTRAHFGEKEKLTIEALHHLIVGIRCVKVTSQDDTGGPPRSLVWVYVPDGKSRELPFTKEHEFWRFDFAQYDLMQKKHK